MTLQVKLTEASQAKTSQDSGFLDMLQKVVFRKQDGGGGGSRVACFSGCLQVSAGMGVAELSREWGYHLRPHPAFMFLSPRSASSSTSHRGPMSPFIIKGHHTTLPAEPESS